MGLFDKIKEQASSQFDDLKQKTVDLKDTITDTEKLKEFGKEKYQEFSDNSNAKKQEKAEIKDQIDNLDVSRTYRYQTRKDLKDLTNVLNSGETALYATPGHVKDGIALIVVTDRRLLFSRKGMVFGRSMTDFPLNTINAVSYKMKIRNADVSFTNGAETIVISDIKKSDAPELVTIIKEAMATYKEKDRPNIIVNQTDGNNSNADELMKYKQLLDMGAITQEEFDRKKSELL